ncbi:MAG: helicase, partial [Acidobacteriota bacterium]
MNYEDFLVKKKREWAGAGILVSDDEFSGLLYPFQRKLSQWALRKGRAAIWADTGLGKTFMQLAWAEKIPGRVLILAPLCVSAQTMREAARLGID